MNKYAYELGQKTANIRTALIGRLGRAQKPAHSLATLGIGGALSGAATPIINQEEWGSSTLGGKAGLIFQNAMLGGAGALSGHDRFGLAGALGGLGLAGGASRLFSSLKPEGDSFKDYGVRAVIEGAKSSLGGSLMMSSLMRGGGLRNVFPVMSKIIASTPGLEKQIGRPGSYISGMLSKGTKKPGYVAKWWDLVSGSPNVASAVEKASRGIPGVPANKYLIAQGKDIIGGSVAGLAMAPLTMVGGYMGHKKKENIRGRELDE